MGYMRMRPCSGGARQVSACDVAANLAHLGQSHGFR